MDTWPLWLPPARSSAGPSPWGWALHSRSRTLSGLKVGVIQGQWWGRSKETRKSQWDWDSDRGGGGGESPGIVEARVLQPVTWIQGPVRPTSPAKLPGHRGPSQGPPQASDPHPQMNSCPVWRAMRSPSPPEWTTMGHCWPSRPLPPGGSVGAQGLQQSPASSTRWPHPAPTSC